VAASAQEREGPAAESSASPDGIEFGDPSGTSPGGSSTREALIEDVEALIGDGFNYFDAELSFQKTRAKFVGDRIFTAILFGLIAAIVALLAVFGFVFGMILALTPLITAWGATAVVVGVLALLAWWLVRIAKGAIRSLKLAFSKSVESDEHGES